MIEPIVMNMESAHQQINSHLKLQQKYIHLWSTCEQPESVKSLSKFKQKVFLLLSMRNFILLIKNDV